MNQELERFLNLRHFPQRVTMEQGAGILGVGPHEMPMLIAKGLLKPLGRPASNGQKFFLSAVLKELEQDQKWWDKANITITSHWQYKNSRKGNGVSQDAQASPPRANATEFVDAEN